MRKTIFILSLVFNTLIFAQNSESSTRGLKEYNNLMNYTPEKFKLDSIYKSEHQLWKADLNTFGTIKTYYAYKTELGLSDQNIKWLEDRIRQLATSFFLEEKMILLIAVGGYSGCPDNMIDTIRLENKEVIRVKFCHNCTDSYRDGNFIAIFNARMYSLMKIEPSNKKTKSFYGEYSRKDGSELFLRSDRTFQYMWYSEEKCSYTEGVWRNQNDTLILNSKILNNSEETSENFANAKWVELIDLEFLLEKEKLAELKKVNGKLKRIGKKRIFSNRK